MRKQFIIAAVAASFGLAACGGSEESRVPTAEEDRKMNEIAAELDSQTIDTSPDSLVAEEGPIDGNAAAGEEQPAEEGAPPAE